MFSNDPDFYEHTRENMEYRPYVESDGQRKNLDAMFVSVIDFCRQFDANNGLSENFVAHTYMNASEGSGCQPLITLFLNSQLRDMRHLHMLMHQYPSFLKANLSDKGADKSPLYVILENILERNRYRYMDDWRNSEDVKILEAIKNAVNRSTWANSSVFKLLRLHINYAFHDYDEQRFTFSSNYRNREMSVEKDIQTKRICVKAGIT